MVSLAGLSATYPGELEAEQVSTQNDIRKIQLDQAKVDIAGQQALGRVFQQMVPGSQPNMPPQPMQAAPQPPPPGQGSQPMQPPPRPPVSPPGPAAGGAVRPQAGMPVGAPPGGAQAPGQLGGGPPPNGGQPNPQLLDKFDLKTAAQAIAKANPGIDGRTLVSALNAALPYLNAEAKQEVALLRQQMQQENLDLRQRSLEQRENQFEAREQRIKDENEAKQKRFDTREARLEAKQAIQNDQAVAKLALQQKGLEYKIAAGDRTATMAQWRAIADAKRKAALAAASIYSVNNGLDDKQKAKLLKDVNDAAEEEITNMRNLSNSSTTPTGGTPKADGTKTSGKVSDQPKPIPPEIRGQYDAFVKEHPELREKAIEKLKADGYVTDGL